MTMRPGNLTANQELLAVENYQDPCHWRGAEL
jgi:hypothetical protein